jgi:hypothetical protein
MLVMHEAALAAAPTPKTRTTDEKQKSHDVPRRSIMIHLAKEILCRLLSPILQSRSDMSVVMSVRTRE